MTLECCKESTGPHVLHNDLFIIRPTGVSFAIGREAHWALNAPPAHQILTFCLL
jgi:hypothetical protein